MTLDEKLFTIFCQLGFFKVDGRLDLESKGLLLFTRNGKINDALTKPGNCIKVYEVWVRGHVTDEHIIDASSGVESIHGLLKAKVTRIGNGGAKTKLRVELEDGKNRHIRRLFGALKDPKLFRVILRSCGD